MARIETYVEVDVDLDEFDDDELLDEIERRKLSVLDASPDEARRLLEEIYYKRVMNQDFTAALDKYLYEVLGRIV